MELIYFIVIVIITNLGIMIGYWDLQKLYLHYTVNIFTLHGTYRSLHWLFL